MKLASDGKINVDGIISSNEMITEKEGYEAMLYMLKAYWEATGSNDLTDILSGGEYWVEINKPAGIAFLPYRLDEIEKLKMKDHHPYKNYINSLLKFANESFNQINFRYDIWQKDF